MNPVSIVSVSASDWVNQMATTIFLTPNSILRNSFDCGHALQFLCSNHKFRSRQIFLRKCYGSRGGFSLNRGFRLFCQSKTEEMQIRRYSPFLESVLLDANDASVSDEWRAVPDIWRSSAEKYGDRVALVDPYHDPPSNLTYKQLEQEILDFSEGLRVVGVKPEEKIALFADNSCRWLVADQGCCLEYELKACLTGSQVHSLYVAKYSRKSLR